MDFTTSVIDPEVDRFSLIGRLDAAGVEAIDQRLAAALAATGRHVLMDLTRLDFVSSLGLRLFITSARGLARRDRRLILVGPNPQPAEVFQSVALSDLIPVVATEAAALEVLRPQAAARFSRRLVPGSAVVSGGCEALGQYLRTAGAGDITASRAELLVEELALNAMEHGGAPDVAVVAFAADEGWTLVVEDAGTPFDPSTAPLPEPVSLDLEMPEGRLGLRLVRRIARAIRYARLPDGRNRVELVLP